MKAILSTALVLAITSVVPAAAADICPRIGTIDDWKAPDSKTIIIETVDNKKFKLDLMGSCSAIRFKETVAFKAFGGVSPLSCLTAGDSVLYKEFDSIRRCPIQAVTLYTPEMEAADKAAREEKKNETD